jgi:hypothetical protein
VRQSRKHGHGHLVRRKRFDAAVLRKCRLCSGTPRHGERRGPGWCRSLSFLCAKAVELNRMAAAKNARYWRKAITWAAGRSLLDAGARPDKARHVRGLDREGVAEIGESAAA